MAKILDFLTRDAYQAKLVEGQEPVKPLVGMALFHRLFEVTLEDLDPLIKKYKAAGVWTPTAELSMNRAIDHLNTVCGIVSGVITHESKTKIQNVGAHTDGPGSPSERPSFVGARNFLYHPGPGDPTDGKDR